MKHSHTIIDERPELIMSFKNWLSCRLNPREILFNVSAVDGSDFHQPFPLGIAVFLVDGIPSDPAGFYQAGVGAIQTSDYLVNSIFSINTTYYAGRVRERYAAQLANIPHVFSRHENNNNRLSARETIAWYRQTPFTASPRGNGLDCHRTYEALIFGSIPVVAGADETLRKKYEDLPVWFVDDYSILADPAVLVRKRAEIMETTYNFNLLTRSYWEKRRPDINLLMQSVYWLKRFNKFTRVRQYFYENDYQIIDRINPVCYPNPVRTSSLQNVI